MTALLLLVPFVHAYGLDPQEVTLYDEVAIMEGALYETGYLPSDDSVGINFALVANQFAQVEMGAFSELTWPEAVTLAFTGDELSGWLGIIGEIALVTTLKIDLWGYQGEWELDRRSLEIFAETIFNPLVLQDSDPASVFLSSEGIGTEAFDLTYELFSGVSAGVTVDIVPYLETTLNGLSISHNGVIQEKELDTVLLDVPSNGYLEIVSQYMAAWDASMEILIVPTIEVCASVFGCYDVASFDIPIDMGSNYIEDPFDPATVSYELPVMTPPDESYDFGEVYIGNLANWNMGVLNGGIQVLEGEVGVTGSSYFSAWPDFLMAGSESEDGVVVTFAPEEPGEFSGTLLLMTNDPANPTYEVALTGIGIVEEEPEENAIINSEVGCGCQNTNRLASAWWGLLILPMLVVSRRRV